MRNPIRVWRSPENEAVARALQNLQDLASGIKDVKDEAEEKHGETRYISEVTAEGTTNVEQ